MHTTSRGVIVALCIATAAAGFGLGWIASPHEPPAPGDLAASLREALGESDLIERQGRTARLLERLDTDRVPEVAALYEQMTPVIGPLELGAFFAAWARFDALGALEYALAWPMIEMKEQREIGVLAAIQAWALRDPTAARMAFEQIGADHPRLRDALRRGLVTGWVHSSRGRDGLAPFLAELPPLRRRDETVEVVVRELLRSGGADAALDWAEPTLRSEEYDSVFKRSVFVAATDLVAQWDGRRAAAWAGEHAKADYAAEGPSIVAEHWARQDGAACLAWLSEQPAGDVRDEAVREAFGGWTRTNPLGARAWLESAELTAFHDPALEVKAKRLAGLEPERAIGWCERIQDAERRQRCVENTAKTWYSKDAVAAETWLQQSSLDEETRGRVRRAPRPEGPRRPGGRRPAAAGGAD